jgi:lipopolysaccharide export system protein LptA
MAGGHSTDAGLLKPYRGKNPAIFRRATLWLRATRVAARGAWTTSRRSVMSTCRSWAAGLLLFYLVCCRALFGMADEISLPRTDPNHPITVSADRAWRWEQGAYEVWLLEGNSEIRQGPAIARSHTAVLWIDRNNNSDQGQTKLIAYLETDVHLDFARQEGGAKLTDNSWLGRLHTNRDVEVRVPLVESEPSTKPAAYHRAVARRRPPPDSAIRRTQFMTPVADAPPPQPAPVGTRRIRMFQRSNVPVHVRWEPDPNTNQAIATVDSGVNLIIDGLSGASAGPIDVSSIDVSTDRMVIWTVNVLERNENGEAFQADNVPLEIYLEGNIVFRQGEREIFADRMYYDVKNRTGVILNAELFTPVPNYEGLLRLRANVLQQTGENRFFAENSFITSSRMGQPGYRIQTANTSFEDHPRSVIDPITGEVAIDPETGEPIVEHDYLATSRDNRLYLGRVPVFYWPFLATDVTDPSFYINRVRAKNDSVFGTQILTDWDAYQLLGIRNKPAGTEWDISLDYLSERGFGHGTTFTYGREGFLGTSGPAYGLIDFWGIQDRGLDNLGRWRRNLVPEKDYRHRLFWQHRQLLPGDFQLSAEVGWISDRNFLEQYYEREWDELKDQSTGLELKRTRDNISWSVSADKRINRAFTQTEWLPRGDHFWLGESLLNDRLTWYEHSSAGLARFRTASLPEDPADRALFRYLPWETDSGGGPLSANSERFATRQEIDLPFQLGPFKMVPYVLGELAHWGENLNGDDVQRAYGQVGIRASVPMWKVNPMVQSELLNVHGISHKIVFDAELALAESNHSLADLPLYDPLDDDSIEDFRRRFTVTTFGGVVPPQFDERFYALRSGMGGWVTAPSTEIADDLMALRMGMRHRWQTKRGKPGNRRIVDWVTFDTHATWFPDADDDNFGEALGLVDYDARWHVGDRLTLLSTGAFDFFDSGQRLVNFGGFLTRPPLGSLYLGLHLLDGPISSSILSTSFSYRMSEKWVSSFGMSVDIGGAGNIGQNLAITRVGESFLVSAGFNVDASRDNVGLNLTIEPRFLPKTRLGQAGGARIPVAGTYGLE